MFIGWLAACTPDTPLPRPAEPDPLGPDALFDATYTFTSIGPRQVATEGEVLACDAVVAGLLGLNPVEEPFVYDAWRPGTATITVAGQTRPVEALSPTAATDVTLPLADEALAGSAAVLSSADGSRAEAFVEALAADAQALIRVTDLLDFDGSPLVEVGHLLQGTTLPAVATDQPTGDWLREHLGEPARLVVSPTIAADHTSSNVAARIPGTSGDDAQVFVVAHYDSWHPSESAFDNALGAGALLLLAQHAARSAPPERDLVFLATSAEEQGLQGASAWAAAHDDEVGYGDVVIVLDVMYSGEGTYLALATRDDLLEDALDATREAGLPATAGGDPGLGSDHFPFVVRGAEAIWVGRWPDRHYHTVADTIDALDFDEAALALKANWALIAQHAGIVQ